MRTRLANVCQAMPGMTPDRIWDLPQVEWWIVATFADQWAEEQRKLRTKAR